MTKTAAIITPVYKKDLTAAEKAAVSFLIKNSGGFKRYIVLPQIFEEDRSFSAYWQDKGFELSFFPDSFFKGIAGYNRFMLSLEFYERFSNFDYILISQLDALILSPDLEEWISNGYDYIGAPWVFETNPLSLGPTCNGGFSLRRIDSFIGVLKSKKFYFSPEKLAATPTSAGLKYILFLKLISCLPILSIFFDLKKLFLRIYKGNEDCYWAFFSKFFTQTFYVCAPEEALDFAFEKFPEFCFQKNKKSLPFGVHAWERYDKKFWLKELPELKKEIL